MRKHAMFAGAVFATAVLTLLLLSTALLGCQSLETAATASAVETTAGTAATLTTLAPATTEAPTTSQSPTTTAGTPTSIAPEMIAGVPSVLYEDDLLSLYRPDTSAITNGGFEQFLPLTQSPQVAIVLPEELFDGTNLIEAGVYMGVKAVADLPGFWEDPYGPLEEAAGNTDFAGLTWTTFTASEGAAGNTYDQRIYRTVSGDRCFEVVEFLHSGQIGAYEPGTVEEFDRAKFEGYLEAIVRSLTLQGVM